MKENLKGLSDSYLAIQCKRTLKVRDINVIIEFKPNLNAQNTNIPFQWRSSPRVHDILMQHFYEKES